MTERLRSEGFSNPKMENDLSPRKTMLVVVIVVGCFAVLWPKVFYPMLVGSANQQMKPSAIDKTVGCCDVISETDINTIKIMTELCGTIIKTADNKTLTGKEIFERCRQAVLNTCGIDVSLVLQEQVRLGQSVRQILQEIRSLNGSLCLKYNFGVAPWRLGVPHRITIKATLEDIKQERPIHLRSELVHPAFRERGRAIPQTDTPPRSTPQIVDGRPGPIPGMRPTIGGAGHVVPPPKQGTSSMSIIMPIYTIGIVIFFTYTLMKIIFKRPPECIGSTMFTSVDTDAHYRKEAFDAEIKRLGPRLSTENISNKLVVNAMSALLEEVDQEIEARRKNNEVAIQDLTNGTHLSNGTVVKTPDEDQPTVTVLGMEMTASCENGKKWSRPISPVIPIAAPPSQTEIVDPPQEIYLEGALPPQSQLLVSEAATEPEPATDDGPAVVLSGKMTLSVISLDSEDDVEALEALQVSSDLNDTNKTLEKNNEYRGNDIVAIEQSSVVESSGHPQADIALEISEAISENIQNEYIGGELDEKLATELLDKTIEYKNIANSDTTGLEVESLEPRITTPDTFTEHHDVKIGAEESIPELIRSNIAKEIEDHPDDVEFLLLETQELEKQIDDPTISQKITDALQKTDLNEVDANEEKIIHNNITDTDDLVLQSSSITDKIEKNSVNSNYDQQIDTIETNYNLEDNIESNFDITNQIDADDGPLQKSLIEPIIDAKLENDIVGKPLLEKDLNHEAPIKVLLIEPKEPQECQEPITKTLDPPINDHPLNGNSPKIEFISEFSLTDNKKRSVSFPDTAPTVILDSETFEENTDSEIYSTLENDSVEKCPINVEPDKISITLEDPNPVEHKQFIVDPETFEENQNSELDSTLENDSVEKCPINVEPDKSSITLEDPNPVEHKQFILDPVTFEENQDSELDSALENDCVEKCPINVEPDKISNILVDPNPHQNKQLDFLLDEDIAVDLLKSSKNASDEMSGLEKDIEEFLHKIDNDEKQQSITVTDSNKLDSMEVESIQHEMENLIQQAIENVEKSNQVCENQEPKANVDEEDLTHEIEKIIPDANDILRSIVVQEMTKNGEESDESEVEEEELIEEIEEIVYEEDSEEEEEIEIEIEEEESDDEQYNLRISNSSSPRKVNGDTNDEESDSQGSNDNEDSDSSAIGGINTPENVTIDTTEEFDEA